MIILFLLFLVQFALACACLALSSEQQHKVLKVGWSQASDQLKQEMQEHFSCCGFDNETVADNLNENGMNHPPCDKVAIYFVKLTLNNNITYNKY